VFICKICGGSFKEKFACYLKRRDTKIKTVKILKVCRECKYGRPK